MLRALAICALLASVANAEDGVSGYTVYGAGPLSGHVTDQDGKPLAGIEVHAVSKSGGERVVTANADGVYQLQLVAAPGEASMVYVNIAHARIGGETAVTINAGPDGEAIEVRAAVPPAVMPKPRDNPAAIPDYSDAAIDKNVWAKTWILLDIDETGTVKHVKFLKRAGFDLDPIAVRAAFKLRFEAARDRANHPMRAAMLWSFEWPSWYWLQSTHSSAAEVPVYAMYVACQKPGENRIERRDCSGPDLARGLVESWIAPRKK